MKEAGATEFLIADGHGTGYDMMLDFDRIDPDVTFVTGNGNPMDAVDDSFSAAFIIGQHPKKGVRGSLEHTGSHMVNQGMWVNENTLRVTAPTLHELYRRYYLMNRVV